MTRAVTPAHALAWHEWPGWSAEPAEDTRRLDVTELPRRDSAQVRGWIDKNRTLLVRVFDEWLDRVGQALSVVGCPAETVVPLLAGLVEIGSGSPEFGSRAWTFSTFEIEHDDDFAGRTDVVFLPVLPRHSTRNATRVIVNLGSVESGQPGRRAIELVEDYLVPPAERVGPEPEPPSLPAVHPPGLRVSTEHPAHPAFPDPWLRHGESVASRRGPVPPAGARAIGPPVPYGPTTHPVEQSSGVEAVGRGLLVSLVAGGVALFAIGALLGVMLGRSGQSPAATGPVIGDLPTPMVAVGWQFRLVLDRRGSDASTPRPVASSCTTDPVRRLWSCEIGRNGAQQPDSDDDYVLVARPAGALENLGGAELPPECGVDVLSKDPDGTACVAARIPADPD
ncbi:MAG: hypothetical protein ACR2GH_07385 [Pseudonocardia sp.]